MPSATSPPSPHSNALPSPQTFDIVPPLHALLSRLLVSSVEGSAESPISPKDLATEAAAIKIKIQKARAAAETLPDIHRTVAEQEEEIDELYGRIVGLKKVLGQIAEGKGDGQH
ncbi:hypothetical protein MMC24_004584 [Lignoscripta atroalba]|nr:hypothetical protein [Lignoscripta atroalba]